VTIFLNVLPKRGEGEAALRGKREVIRQEGNQLVVGEKKSRFSLKGASRERGSSDIGKRRGRGSANHQRGKSFGDRGKNSKSTIPRRHRKADEKKKERVN